MVVLSSKFNNGLENFSIILFFSDFKDFINNKIKNSTAILFLSKYGDINYS